MKTLKESFLLHILSLGVLFLFLSLAGQSFAGFYIHISGAVQSYKNGMYQIKTNNALIKVQNSKLTPHLKEEMNKRIGRRIQLGIPSHAILSYKKVRKHRRRPAASTHSKLKNKRNKTSKD